MNKLPKADAVLNVRPTNLLLAGKCRPQVTSFCSSSMKQTYKFTHPGLDRGLDHVQNYL